MQTKSKRNRKSKKRKGAGPNQSKPAAEEEISFCEIPLNVVIARFRDSEITTSPATADPPSTGYKVLELPVSNKLVENSILIAKAYTENRVLKPDHWSFKSIDTSTHFKFFNMVEDKNYVKVGYQIYADAYDGAVEVLNTNGFTVGLDDRGKINIAYTNADTTIVTSGFSSHCDNQGFTNKKVNSIVVYVDVNCEGGELEIYKDGRMFGSPVVEEVISPMTQNPDTRKVVLLDGDKYHCPRPVISGKRIAVVYNIKQ